MSARTLEAFLTRIYVDARARACFNANPRGEAQRAGLSEKECAELGNIDWVDLEMVARSFAQKRQSRLKRNDASSLRDRMHHVFAVLSKRLRSIL